MRRVIPGIATVVALYGLLLAGDAAAFNLDMIKNAIPSGGQQQQPAQPPATEPAQPVTQPLTEPAQQPVQTQSQPAAAPPADESANLSCDVIRGRTNTKINKASYQPDIMHTSKFIKQPDVLRIYKEDGLTCKKVETKYQGYSARYICFKNYNNVNSTYKFIETQIKCKKDVCDQPTLYCSTSRNHID